MIQRTLIVNADDFGQSLGITRGVIEAHERGIVTSASLMVLWPNSADAVAYARARPALGVGLHVDLGEWMCRNGGWQAIYERVDLTDADMIERTIRGQLEGFRDLLGRNPTHLDSHQHVHCREPVRSIVMCVAQELRVPLRHFASTVRHHGAFYGQGASGEPLHELISVSRLVEWLRRLPTGMTELACHPGYANDLETMYRAERTVELETLCDSEVQRTIAEESIELASFAKLQTT